MNALVTAYVLYLVAATALTALVGATLSRHGKIFLTEVFGNDVPFARSVNQLLVAGFYLVSFGFVALTLTTDTKVTNVADVFELLSVKLGVVALGLGALHLTNVAVFNNIRKRHRAEVELRANGGIPPAYPGTAASYATAGR